MKIPKLRWVLAGMLFLATAINYTDRGALSIVSSDIRKEFHMTEQDYSLILVGFMLAYAIMYAGSGYLVDRLGTKRGFALFIGFWSGAAMLHGFARGFWSLMACRFLLGLGEPGNWPAAAKAIGEWFPARQRALGVGIFNAGSSLGSALAGPVIATLTLMFGWRVAFVFTGAIGFAWLAVWWILYDPPHTNRWLRADEYAELKDHVEPPEQTRAASADKVNWRKVIRMRECYTLILARFFTDPVIYFVIFWMPEYLHKERQFNLEEIGRYGWVPFLFGGIGYVFGGWLSGRLMRAGWEIPAARKAVMLMGAAVMPIAIFAPHAPNAAIAIGCICFLTWGHAFFTANLQALPTDLFEGYEVGTSSGFSGMGGAIGGMIANLGTGYIVQHFSYAPVFFLAGLMHPLATGLVYLLLPARRCHVVQARGLGR